MAKGASIYYAKSVATYSSKKYKQCSDYLQPKIDQARIDYAPQLLASKKKYESAKMLASGYSNESVSDSSNTSFITDFEWDLPLRHISLVEFERRLKKLVCPEMGDKVTV